MGGRQIFLILEETIPPAEASNLCNQTRDQEGSDLKRKKE